MTKLEKKLADIILKESLEVENIEARSELISQYGTLVAAARIRKESDGANDISSIALATGIRQIEAK